MTMHVNGIYNTQLVLMQMYCILHVFSIFDFKSNFKSGCDNKNSKLPAMFKIHYCS